MALALSVKDQKMILVEYLLVGSPWKQGPVVNDMAIRRYPGNPQALVPAEGCWD